MNTIFLIRRILLLPICLTLLSLGTFGQDTPIGNSDCPPEEASNLIIKQNKLKAVYLHLISQSVEFEEKKTTKVKVAFLELDSIHEYVVKGFYDRIQKTKNETNITTYKIKDLSEVSDYDLVYIDCNYEFEKAKLEEAIRGTQTLVVTDNRAETNLMLNFKIINCKIQYELNEKAMLDHRIIPSQALIKGAI